MSPQNDSPFSYQLKDNFNMTKFSFFQNHNFSASEKVIIDFLSNHNFSNLTIGELAKKTATSNATIIRLSKKAGFKGFSELKIALIKENEENKFTKQEVDFSFPFSPADSLDEIEQSMANLYQNAIQKLRAQIDKQILLRIAREIISKDRVFIFGTGDSGLTSRSFINKINKLNIYPIFASANGEEDHNWQNIRKTDLAIIITYGNSKRALATEGIKTINQHGGKIALITANPASVAGNEIDYLLRIPQEEGTHKLATFYSQFAFEYVLNLIFSIVYKELTLNR